MITGRLKYVNEDVDDVQDVTLSVKLKDYRMGDLQAMISMHHEITVCIGVPPVPMLEVNSLKTAKLRDTIALLRGAMETHGTTTVPFAFAVALHQVMVNLKEIADGV